MCESRPSKKLSGIHSNLAGSKILVFFFFFFFKFKVNFKPSATSLFCALSVHLFARKLKYCVEHQKGRKSCQIDIKIVDNGDLTFSMTAQAERSCASSQAVNGT